MDVVLWLNGLNLKYFYCRWSLYPLLSLLYHTEIIPFVCYYFIDQPTENDLAWKTIQLGHATGRQGQSWL
jgi:hypothetical protein